MLALRILAVVAGLALVWATVGSAIRTVILPRGIPAKIGRFVFVSVRVVFRLRLRRTFDYETRDRVMAVYGPLSLLVLLATWVGLVVAGFVGVYWGLNGGSLQDALILSGSSVFTLGFARGPTLASIAFSFVEAAIGLVLLAMLITYLPSIYQAFGRRESAVTALEVRAGSPPSGVEMIWRYHALERMERLSEVWSRWEDWFVDIEESHTSFPALVFFRSPQPDHSWVTGAGAVLDAASLVLSSVDIPRDVQAEFCVRAGYLALRRVADFFGIPYNPRPKPDDPIAITRQEFEEAYQGLLDEGVPMKPDRDQAWKDFAGWRVNYETVLIALAGLTMAPYAPWSSDRSLKDWRPPLLLRRLKRRSLADQTADHLPPPPR
jgi:hypothetical protein